MDEAAGVLLLVLAGGFAEEAGAGELAGVVDEAAGALDERAVIRLLDRWRSLSGTAVWTVRLRMIRKMTTPTTRHTSSPTESIRLDRSPPLSPSSLSLCASESWILGSPGMTVRFFCSTWWTRSLL